MNALVVYDSQFGNTERVARAVAEVLDAGGQARASRVNVADPVELQGVDLLIVGCPTQGWRPTRAMQTFLQAIPTDRLRGLAAASFDTRFQKPRWMTGSAAGVMVRRLRKMGIALLVPPESFFVDGKEGPLVSGELERAALWARTLSSKAGARHPVAPEASTGCV